jgi:hypothetical protein
MEGQVLAGPLFPAGAPRALVQVAQRPQAQSRVQREQMWGTIDERQLPLRRGAGLEAEQRQHPVNVYEQQGTVGRHCVTID